MNKISITPLTAADGTPLRKKLAQAMFRSRVRAVGLVIPLLGFVLASFVFPILALMWQGVYNDRFESLMPNLTEELRVWDGVSEPTEEMYALLVLDLRQNPENALSSRGTPQGFDGGDFYKVLLFRTRDGRRKDIVSHQSLLY